VEVFKKKIIGQLCIHYFPQITSVICVVLLGKQAQDNAAAWAAYYAQFYNQQPYGAQYGGQQPQQQQPVLLLNEGLSGTCDRSVVFSGFLHQ
jgi:hypothetical protein